MAQPTIWAASCQLVTRGTCTTGTFVSGTPDYVSYGGVVTQVGGAQSGSNALFTQPNTGGAGTHDVDGGECIATSPLYNVTQSSNVSIWYFHGQRDNGDDPSGDWFYLEVSVAGGAWQTLGITSSGRLEAGAPSQPGGASTLCVLRGITSSGRLEAGAPSAIVLKT